MQAEKRRKLPFIGGLTAACGLIAAGGILIGQTFGLYGSQILKQQDAELLHLARMIDKNIDGLLGRCAANLSYVTGQEDFRAAAELWQRTGDTKPLQERMRENPVAQDPLIYSMIAVQDGEVVLAAKDEVSCRLQETAGELEYQTDETQGTEYLQPCVGADGALYLALFGALCGEEQTEGMPQEKASEALQYAALIDLDVFYREIAGEELGVYEWIILTDRTDRILMYSQQEQLRIEEADGETSATCGDAGVEFLLSQQGVQQLATVTYEYPDSKNGQEYTARMVALPTEETQNGAFAVGVVTNYEEVIAPFQKAGFLMILYGGMIIAGVVLLLNQLLRFRKRNEKDLQELQILREKNEAMAELNRRAEEIAHLQRLETIGTLTSGIAHEFNNLLTPIMGYSILTLEQLPSEREDLQDNVLEIYQAACRAKEITLQLSGLSRKNTTFSSTRIRLDQLAEKALNVALPAKPENVNIITNMEQAGCCIEGNETQISQLILNLVLNGFQAMEKTGGTLTVSVEAETERVILRVADTGPGIPKKQLGRIFEPFFTTKEAGKGTGLGLAVVQQVVSEHQGTIEAVSAEGEGCVFIVKFPKITETFEKEMNETDF